MRIFGVGPLELLVLLAIVVMIVTAVRGKKGHPSDNSETNKEVSSLRWGTLLISLVSIAAGAVCLFVIAPEQFDCGGLFCIPKSTYQPVIYLGGALVTGGIIGLIGGLVMYRVVTIDARSDISIETERQQVQKDTALPRNMEIRDEKRWQKAFTTVLGWNEPLSPTSLKTIGSLSSPFDKTDIIFIVRKDTKKFFINEVRINTRETSTNSQINEIVLDSKYFSTIAMPNRLIFVSPDMAFTSDCFYSDIVSVHPDKMFSSNMYTIMTKDRKIFLCFSASKNDVTKTELSQYDKLLTSFFTSILPQNLQVVETQLASNNVVTKPNTDADLRKDLLEAELSIANGDRKNGALLIDKVLRQDFANPAAWQLLYQLLGNGKEFSAFQKEFALRYYPDKAHLLSK